MTDHYIPFDIGSWRSDEGRMCRRHGKHYGGPLFQVTPSPGETPIVRQYCGLCFLDWIDRVMIANA